MARAQKMRLLQENFNRFPKMFFITRCAIELHAETGMFRRETDCALTYMRLNCGGVKRNLLNVNQVTIEGAHSAFRKLRVPPGMIATAFQGD